VLASTCLYSLCDYSFKLCMYCHVLWMLSELEWLAALVATTKLLYVQPG